LSNRRVNLPLVGDIERERFGLTREPLFEVSDLLDLAGGSDHPAAGFEDLFGELATEASRGTSDKPNPRLRI